MALTEARLTGADHLVVTGDLTEDGMDAQFEVLADVLVESGWTESRVTLVPGNHDAYIDPTAWDRALAGPLRAYRETSTTGVPVFLRNVAILPISTACAQPYTRSAGTIEGRELEAAVRIADQSRLGGRACVLAMHHPPHRRSLAMQWIDGLQNHAQIGEVLDKNDHAHVLHGHTHVWVDRPVRPGATPRIFSTEAVVDGQTPLRVYQARHGRLWPEPREGGTAR
jgi:3',5'-cyclic AMP phosphodiesterase CpdA